MTLIGKMRRAIAFIPAMFAAVVPAAAQETAKPRLIDIRLRESSDIKAGLLRRAAPVGALAPWVSATDFPADMQTGNRSGTVTLRISIDASDRMTDCQTETTAGLAPHLAAWACEQVRQHGKFRHALSEDGKPVGDVVTMRMTFNLASDPLPMLPPAPPAPPLPAGASVYRPDLKLVDMPEQALRAAPTLTGSAILQIYLWYKRDGSLDRPYCSIARSSGDADIDKASCAAATSASYAFIMPDRKSGAMQIRLRWQKGRAKVEYPSRDRETPLDLRFDSPFTPTSTPFSETGYFVFTFQPGGKVDCRVTASTGNDALDVATCRDGMAHARFKPEINLFGEAVSTRTIYWLSPSSGRLGRVR